MKHAAAEWREAAHASGSQNLRSYRHFDDAIPPLPEELIGFDDSLQRESMGEKRSQIHAPVPD